ncbi:von Willebrand factor type A domain-containing protein [Methanococcoides vulcani]|uniref:von Willebrand factor type A domain-containing protein n=1 Tax=Methanococcoides vulcani TaxID=1353158 RepID=A0A1I0A8U4_9EURY|nr:VWA domain-containing protein [Methanococcoides vulcani]SES90563.1 von Willebrand factor type A domain-containing protein [Methanococcoides vulcani]
MSQDEGEVVHLKDVLDILDSTGMLEDLSDVEISEISVEFGKLPLELLVLFRKHPSRFVEWFSIWRSSLNKDKGLGNVYFSNTFPVLLDLGSATFSGWVELVTELNSLNPSVGKAFLRNIEKLVPLMDPDILEIWYPIVQDLAGRKWRVAIELIERTVNVLPALPKHQRKLLLLSSKEFRNIDLQLFLTFFTSAPLALAALSKSEFDKWTYLGGELAFENREVATLFLKITPKFIGRIDIEDLAEYVEMGKELFSYDEPEAARTFYEAVFRGLGNGLHRSDREGTRHLIDIGVQLTNICWRCVESFFENAPEMRNHLDEEEFDEWVSIGKGISQSSTFYGSDYFHSSLSVLKNTDRKYYPTLFNNAKLLAENNGMLAGIYFSILSDVLLNIHPREIERWVHTGLDVFGIDREMAFSFFRNSPALLKDLDVTELDEWAKKGLSIFERDRGGGRSYFSLMSKSATEFAEKLMSGVALKRVSRILKYYSVGISGINFTIRSKNFLSGEFSKYPNPIVSGRTIYLEPTVKGYGDFEENFTIYKLAVMHEVGHIQFGTSVFELEAFLPLVEKIGMDILDLPGDVGVDPAGKSNAVASVIGKLSAPFIAADIMGIIEDARVEYMTTSLYRGLRREFEKVRMQMSQNRAPDTFGIGKFTESLLLYSVGIEPSFGIEADLKEIVDFSHEILVNNVFKPDSSTLDSLEVTIDIYEMLTDRFGPLELLEYEPIRNFDYRGMGVGASSLTQSRSEEFSEQVMESFIPQTVLPDDEEFIEGRPGKGPEYANSKNWEVLGSYSYDEWDSRMQDYKNDWCTVYEVSPSGSDNEFYLEAREHYAREITLINRIFKMMKPESFRKLRRQLDGDDFDLDALIEAFTDRKCGINPTDRLYIRRDKRERDVSTLFLLDMSASTRKKLENGRRILDVEKDSLIIMTQALESIGDKYAIAAFSGNTRSDVEFYTIKDFNEHFSEDAECKISALEPAMNTRLGAAIRHSISKLKDIDARVKLLVLLSDGDPYDLGFAEGKYEGQMAIEDTRVAIQEGNALGMHFFCITVDSEAGEYLDTIFSDVGYTIIDNAASLPERLPMLYNRITT